MTDADVLDATETRLPEPISAEPAPRKKTCAVRVGDGAGAVTVGGLSQYSPPATPAPPVSAAPFTVSVTVAAPWVGLGASVMPVKVGAVLSMRIVVVLVGPQFPAASLPWT
jgi:hypothetical protein